jgi:hypothetical protein
MNKRSATFIAATLVGVLAIGGVAFSLGLTGPTASAAAERTTTIGQRSTAQRTIGQKPIIRTHTRTVIVHRQAPATAPTTVQVSSSNSGPSASSGPSISSGPGHDVSDDGVEDEDNHGQDHEGQDDHGDHSSTDDQGDDD